MNRQILRQYIDEYKIGFARVNQQEIYKWKAVKCFQDNWNIEATNFLEVLSQSIRLTQNLLKSGQYFPLRMLVHYATQRPEELRQLFRNLYDEENDIYQRINDFQNGTETINNSLFPGKNTYQDHRAIIVYLTLRYPERYFFYKFEMFKQFSERLELTYRPTKGRIENIGHFNSLCEIVKYELSNDQELLQLHKDRITADCYNDISLNILTQDFIYAVARHLNQQTPVPVASTFQTANEVSATNLSTSTDQLTFRGRTVNFIQNNIDNKRIGDLGELWVLKYEIEKLRQSGLHKLVDKIKHTAKDEGDGTGYDIESYDGNGQKIYIEVKTTKGGKNSTFYITRTELERSKIEKENFYLYRLYNFNEDNDTAEILIIKGDLTNLCEFPTTYKIILTND
ncbi:MAG: DUF3883 domain-containing protein [Candidatus Kapabacteria bacterium]|nr:DUF3883 domain-containing protein [Ignavibacteriota bacterium]MCW5883806.1 DUF3883 domain-containing protein [Candidatus Kapabacteria bacterium]